MTKKKAGYGKRAKGFDLDGVGESSGSSGKEGGSGDKPISHVKGGAQRSDSRESPLENTDGGYISDVLPPHVFEPPAVLDATTQEKPMVADVGKPGSKGMRDAAAKAIVDPPVIIDREGAVAIPLPVPPKPSSLAPHIAKISRFGSYTYSALTTAANLTSSAVSSARQYATSPASSSTSTPKGVSKSLPAENLLGEAHGGLDDLEEGTEDLLEDDSEDDLAELAASQRHPSRMGVKGVYADENKHHGPTSDHLQSDGNANGTARKRKSKFVKIDIGDGHPRQCLLLINPSDKIAIQIWDLSMTTSGNNGRTAGQYETDIKAMQGSTSSSERSMLSSLLLEQSPREIFCLSAGIKDSADTEGELAGEVLDATMSAPGNEDGDQRGHTVLVAATSKYANEKQREKSNIVLYELDLVTGKFDRSRELGEGYDAVVLASELAIVVGIASNACPAIHFMTAEAFGPQRQPITTHLGVSNLTGLPVMTLSGMLLAYASRKSRYSGEGHADGHEPGHGAVVTKRSVCDVTRGDSLTGNLRADYPRLRRRQDPTSPGPDTPMKLLSSAANVSGQVVSGLWGGLKALSTAAVDSAARSGAMTGSAPTAVTPDSIPENSRNRGKPHRRASSGAPGDIARHRPARGMQKGGSWIVILDLGRPAEPSDELVSFSLPTATRGTEGTAGSSPIGCIAFSSSGCQIAVFPEDGRIGFALEIRPTARGKGTPTSGEAWVRYKLLRGYSPASILSIVWNEDDNLIAVSSQNTAHFFAVNPHGGTLALEVFTPGPTVTKGSKSLSTRTSAVFRIRPRGESKAVPMRIGNVYENLPGYMAGQGRAPGKCCIAFSEGKGVLSHGKGIRRVDLSPIFALDADAMQLSICHPIIWADPVGTAVTASRAEDFRLRSRRTSVAEDLALPLFDRAVDALRWKSPLGGRAATHRSWRVASDNDRHSGMKLVKVKRTLHGPVQRFDFLSKAEINTMPTSATQRPTTIYRDSNIVYTDLGRGMTVGKVPSAEGNLKFWASNDSLFNATRSDTGGNLTAALESTIDASRLSPILPALPNGNGYAIRRNSPHPALTAARDIGRMTRKGSSQSADVSSFGGKLAVDQETGFMYAIGTDGEAGPDDRSSRSHEDWQDDLIVGRMDGIPRS